MVPCLAKVPGRQAMSKPRASAAAGWKINFGQGWLDPRLLFFLVLTIASETFQGRGQRTQNAFVFSFLWPCWQTPASVENLSFHLSSLR